MKLHSTLLIACLGTAPLCAQQVEPKPEPPKPSAGEAGSTAPDSARGDVKPEAQPSPTPPSRRPSHPQPGPKPEQKLVAYIGVLTREVPPELRAQFSLAEGFGLLIGEVMPDSPAKAAGLKVYDVLVKFGDQQLVNMEQLMALVRVKKKGDVVQLTVITGGKEAQVSVTLGEHQVEAHPEHPMHHLHSGWAQPGSMHGFHGHAFQSEGPHGFQNQEKGIHEQFERLRDLQQELREYQERVQQWSKGGSVGPMPPLPRLHLPGHESHDGNRHRSGHQSQTGISIPPGTNLERFNHSQSRTAANVTRRDDSGEYTLKNENGQKTFIVRPHNGPEKSWPVNTDAERQAVPEELRDKLRLMDGAGGSIRIEINPRRGPNPPGTPAPANNGGTPPLPPVKAKTTSA